MLKRSLFYLLTLAVIGFIVVYIGMFIINRKDTMPAPATQLNTDLTHSVAIFGATGTAGDGLLKAALKDPNVKTVYVITRRLSDRIKAGMDNGKVKMTIHKDYDNYQAIEDVLREVDTVYCGIGLSAAGLDQETYHRIHVSFPLEFVEQWGKIRQGANRSFHYVSGSGANKNARMMWAREKAQAEEELFNFGRQHQLRVIAYRPAYITPTSERANFLHNLAHAILLPVKFSIRADQIGEAMLEVTARGEQVPGGTILENKEILGYAETYQDRLKQSKSQS